MAELPPNGGARVIGLKGDSPFGRGVSLSVTLLPGGTVLFRTETIATDRANNCLNRLPHCYQRQAKGGTETTAFLREFLELWKVSTASNSGISGKCGGQSNSTLSPVAVAPMCDPGRRDSRQRGFRVDDEPKSRFEDRTSCQLWTDSLRNAVPSASGDMSCCGGISLFVT